MPVHRLVLVLFACLALAPPAAHGQSLRVSGDLDHPSARLLREILARGNFELVRRDTVLPADFHTPGDLVVLGADVRLEGTVGGSAAVVDGALFVRPGAEIRGPIVAAAGGEVYRSGLATMGEILRVPAEAETTLERGESGTLVTLRPPPDPPRLSLGGIFGLGLPTYDRVDGLTLRGGATLKLSGDSIGPAARAMVSYHTARGALGGALALEHPLSRHVWAVAEATRATVTNEEWIRGDLTNSLAAVTFRSDVRDYYLTDEVSLTLVRRPRQPLIAGEAHLLPRLTLRASRDRSVEASDPWSLLGDEWRPVLPIDEGALASVVAGAEVGWQGQTVLLDGDLAVEWAPPGVGDFTFAQAVAHGTLSMRALWGHTIGLGLYARQTLGAEPAPRQRWSFVGGPGTLPTLEPAALRGDRVVFVASTYAVPLPRLSLPVLGIPQLRVEHLLGTAWVTGVDAPRWEQNLGLGLDFGLLQAMVLVNPAEGVGSPELNLSASLPF